jgi:hypothetical protein
LLGKGKPGTENDNTTFFMVNESRYTTPVTIPPPMLNISAFFVFNWTDSQLDLNANNIYDDRYPYGRQWEDPDTGQRPFNVENGKFYEPDSQTLYSTGQLLDAATCQSNGLVAYSWGFSFMLLFSFVVASTVWTFGMWAVYIDTVLHSSPHIRQRKQGLDRAVVDLADALLHKTSADKVRLDANAQLRDLSRDLQLSYFDMSHGETARDRLDKWWREGGLKKWLWAEKYWLTACVFFFVMIVVAWQTNAWNWWHPYWAFLPGWGPLIVLLAGRQKRGRWIFSAPFIVGFAAAQIWWLHSSYGTDFYWVFEDNGKLW